MGVLRCDSQWPDFVGIYGAGFAATSLLLYRRQCVRKRRVSGHFGKIVIINLDRGRITRFCQPFLEFGVSCLLVIRVCQRAVLVTEHLDDVPAEGGLNWLADRAYRQVRPLNENDQALMRRAQKALLGEWGFALSVTPAQAELELHRLLTSAPAGD